MSKKSLSTTQRTVAQLHQAAMEAYDLAVSAEKAGEGARAAESYRDALELESEAAGRVASRIEFEPTRSVLHRSAAAIALRCQEFLRAEQLIAVALSGNPPDEIAVELRELLDEVNRPKTASVLSEKVGAANAGSPIVREAPHREVGVMKPVRPNRPSPAPAMSSDLGDLETNPTGASQRMLIIQYADRSGRWRDLEPLRPGQHLLGRASFRDRTSATEFLATEHLRFVSDEDRLFVEEGQTLNGVYIKLPTARPIELTPGTRFRVGQHVFEFQLPERTIVDQPLVSPDGEVFHGRNFVPLAYVDLVGPGGGPAFRFPLTKLDGTVIGRVGDIALTGDNWANLSHANVTRQGGRFFLEDLGSVDGTFVRITGRTLLKPGDIRGSFSGDVLLLGEVLIRIVEI
jgi:FHA domain